jgi:hypothetical protein
VGPPAMPFQQQSVHEHRLQVEHRRKATVVRNLHQVLQSIVAASGADWMESRRQGRLAGHLGMSGIGAGAMDHPSLEEEFKQLREAEEALETLQTQLARFRL